MGDIKASVGALMLFRFTTAKKTPLAACFFISHRPKGF